MKLFLNLQEAIDYVSNCLICSKVMRMTIDTSVINEVKAKDKRSSSQRSFPNIEMQLVDGLLQSKNKSYDITINPINNKILVGSNQTQKFLWESTYFRKTCATCTCKITMRCHGPAISKESPFPALMLSREELHFTMKGGKRLRIDKYHSSDGDNKNATIGYDNKYLPSLPFDFNKFTSFEQLINRINTLILFH